MDPIIMSDEDSDADAIEDEIIEYEELDAINYEDDNSLNGLLVESVSESTQNMEDFDINITAEHSYLPSLVTVPGHSVFEPGWIGRISCWGHNGVVFPGEMVPMYSNSLDDSNTLLRAIRSTNLFGLLSPDSGDLHLSNYGVLCEFLEATEAEASEGWQLASFKARARQRFRLLHPSKQRIQRHLVITQYEVQILPEVMICDPLYNIRLSSLGGQRNNSLNRARSKQADSLLSSLPPFVFSMTDIKEIIRRIHIYFKELSFENLPEDPLTLSFWVATNLTLPPRDRLALFRVDNGLLRLFMELKHIVEKKSILCCRECMRAICQKDHIFPMSTEGLYTNFCNNGGYIHNITTSKVVTNLTLQGNPSTEFSWFPGYAWTIAVCKNCSSHIGWRFTAAGKLKKPQEFWGLCRKSLVPT